MSTVKDEMLVRAHEVIAALRAEIAQLEMGADNMRHQLQGPSAPVLDCVGYITIKHCSNGGLQVSGNIGDKQYALDLLAHAADSVRAQGRSTLVAADGSPAVSIPSRDVDVHQTIPTRPFGDMPPEDRGDLPPS